MKLMTIVFALSAFLILSGCSKEEETASSPSSAPPAVEKSAVAEKTEQAVKMVEEKVAEVTEQTKEKITQVTEQGQEKVEQMKTQAQGMITSAQSMLPSGTGQTVYSKSCSSCHKMGIIGAPKTGDKATWEPLISGGMEPLVTAAINGKGNMPAKGGNSSLTDDEVKAAVEYMVEQSQ
ncbi:Cytochrome c5 [Desulfuromusa kysingii]|uniref:Cytochrome c5 n=1 Tax=Desulfuromusa kysingii TaxID=37625 RepID=A0A1H3X5N5_9BACT|nr:c-type cytochrome [Desulfuromusa kysingii]SDZ93984.1 Cytochrome c5 [Desulfuromusa kysingii]